MTSTRIDMGSNKGRSLRFRELASLFLASAGLPIIQRPEFSKLSDYVAEDRERGDLQGLVSWTINTRAEYAHDWSGALDQAQADARHDGKDLAATIQFRKGRPIADAYVAMTLETFREILRREQER